MPGQGRVYRALSEYAANLSADDSTEVAWPHADGSSRKVYGHLVKTFVRKLGSCQVLIVKERLDQPIKAVRYWATSEKEADLATIGGWVARRWAIEQFIGGVKAVFGADQSQIHSAKGIVRFWPLGFLGYLFREEQRAALLAQGADGELTIGQTRWHQQKLHQRVFRAWLQARYAEGVTAE